MFELGFHNLNKMSLKRDSVSDTVVFQPAHGGVVGRYHALEAEG